MLRSSDAEHCGYVTQDREVPKQIYMPHAYMLQVDRRQGTLQVHSPVICAPVCNIAARMRVVWTNDLVIQLIDIYQSLPLLWDTLLSDYKNKIKEKDAWHQISTVMNLLIDQIENKIHT